MTCIILYYFFYLYFVVFKVFDNVLSKQHQLVPHNGALVSEDVLVLCDLIQELPAQGYGQFL